MIDFSMNVRFSLK